MTASSGEPAVLSVGAVLGDSDPENFAWRRAITSLGKRVVKARESVESPLRINVVFHVDGRLAPNDFTGVRTARFNASQSHLLIQAAVPTGHAAEAREEVLLGLMSKAVDEAELFARRKGVAADLAAIRAVVESLAADETGKLT